MQTLNILFQNELKKVIAAERERINDILANGGAVTSYADYKFHVGQIQALDRVVDAYCPEIETLISKRGT